MTKYLIISAGPTLQWREGHAEHHAPAPSGHHAQRRHEDAQQRQRGAGEHRVGLGEKCDGDEDEDDEGNEDQVHVLQGLCSSKGPRYRR